ncbi:MAG TPA: Gfo/Idh/MocA family oxidoreductase [Bryobacteraceae bacterium]|nr:Gfo/Idh/MocA family oxidoreductase [Bryobacteraceae bacterium]
MSLNFNRRDFFRTAGGAVSMAAAPALTAIQSGAKPVRFGLIGCGGRGRHDATVLATQAGGQIVALADLLEDKIGPAKRHFDELLKKQQMPPIEATRLYHGWQSARRLAESDLDAVIIAITPYYYPMVLEMVAGTGKHIYCEKPVATDVAGSLKVIDIAKRLDGKVVFHVGLQVPSATAMQEMARRIHSGAIGDIVSAQAFFLWGGGGRKAPPTKTPEEARIRTWTGDRILSGDIIVEQNVHSIDKINWILKAHPISAFAKGARRARTDYGDIWDHFVGQFTYPNGVLVSFHSTQFLKGWSDAGERFFGTRGSSESHYTGGVRIYGEEAWDSGVNQIVPDAETNKMRQFMNDIVTRNYRNEGFRGAESTLSAILLRTAAYEGREVTWDSVFASNQSWDPHIDLKQFG